MRSLSQTSTHGVELKAAAGANDALSRVITGTVLTHSMALQVETADASAALIQSRLQVIRMLRAARRGRSSR